MNEITLKIVDLAGTAFCIAVEDGEKVMRAIAENMRFGNQIVLDFGGIELITSSFLNPAIGDLYEEFTDEEIRSHLRFENETRDDCCLIEYVTMNAKLFYSQKRQREAA